MGIWWFYLVDGLLVLMWRIFMIYMLMNCFFLMFRNYPLLMATWKVAPALAAGCAAILKPSELASVYVLLWLYLLTSVLM